LALGWEAMGGGEPRRGDLMGVCRG
jgi:hypothetical protein